MMEHLFDLSTLYGVSIFSILVGIFGFIRVAKACDHWGRQLGLGIMLAAVILFQSALFLSELRLHSIIGQ